MYIDYFTVTAFREILYTCFQECSGVFNTIHFFHGYREHKKSRQIKALVTRKIFTHRWWENFDWREWFKQRERKKSSRAFIWFKVILLRREKTRKKAKRGKKKFRTSSGEADQLLLFYFGCETSIQSFYEKIFYVQ